MVFFTRLKKLLPFPPHCMEVVTSCLAKSVWSCSRLNEKVRGSARPSPFTVRRYSAALMSGMG